MDPDGDKTYIQAGDWDVDDASFGELQLELGSGLDGLGEVDGCVNVNGSSSCDVDLSDLCICLYLVWCG